ncbi:MAG: hypothetical protein RL755_2092, partial [Pseudomonadota bacterium]
HCVDEEQLAHLMDKIKRYRVKDQAEIA